MNQTLYGSKNFNKYLIKLSIPIIVQNFINSSLSFIDNLMVGQLGAIFVGGVAASNRFFAIMNSGTSSVIATCGIFISQYHGAKDEQKIKESFRISILLSYVLLLPFLLAALFIPDIIVKFFVNDAQIIDVGVRYIRITCLSYLLLCISLSIASAMRSIGQTKIPMYICIINVSIKLMLNGMLMYGWFGVPSFSIEGAAIATLLSRIAELVLYLTALKINEFPFVSKIKDLFSVSKVLMKKIILKLIPFYLNDLLWSTSNSVILKCFGSKGDMNYNSYAISSTILDIFQTLNGGVTTATIVFVSQKLGNGDLKEARKRAYQTEGFGLMMAIFFCICMFLTNYIVPILYNASGNEIIRNARILIIMQSVCFLMFQMSMQNYSIFKAGGDARSILMMDCGSVWLVMIPLLLFGAYCTNMNIFQLYLLGQLGEAVKLVISIYLLKKERWIRNLAK